MVSAARYMYIYAVDEELQLSLCEVLIYPVNRMYQEYTNTMQCNTIQCKPMQYKIIQYTL